MSWFIAAKRSHSKGQMFKDVQLNLFEFLKLNPLAKFKGKNLEGPLRYLKDPATAPEISSEKLITPVSSDNLDESTSSEILGFPTIIERQSYLRYIRFYLKPNGTLHITAPKNRPFETISHELVEYKDWLLKKHSEYEKIRAESPALKWADGEGFPYLGESYKLKLQPFGSHKSSIQFDLDQLHYFYPEKWDSKPIKEKSLLLRNDLLKFYKNKAVIEMSARARRWSETMHLYPKQLSFRNQKTRWGSCSSQGKISLNWRLIAYHPDLVDYIIIHELAHLKHQNHSARFWSLVQSFCPQYEIHRKQLRLQQYSADFLASESELYLENPFLTEIQFNTTTKDIEL